MVKRSDSEWQALFNEHESSGLTAAAFCRGKSICAKHFSLRKRQLGWASSGAFVQVTPAVSEMAGSVSETRIRITDMSVPSDQLERVLAELLR